MQERKKAIDAEQERIEAEQKGIEAEQKRIEAEQKRIELDIEIAKARARTEIYDESCSISYSSSNQQDVTKLQDRITVPICSHPEKSENPR